MSELNPQIGKALKVIATSPKVVPAVVCLSANYETSFKDKLLPGLQQLHETPAGLQVLTICYSERL